MGSVVKERKWKKRDSQRSKSEWDSEEEQRNLFPKLEKGVPEK